MKKRLLAILICFLVSFANAQCISLDDKISQMLILGFKGDSIHSFGFKRILKQVKNNQISGVIYFSRNIKSKDDLIKMNKKLIESSEIIPFISIDHEGGIIQRYNFEQYKTAHEVSNLTFDEARDEYNKMAKLESVLGFNLNFAPCVDLNLDNESIIAKKQRSYGSNYKIVSDYAAIFIEEHNKNKIITSIKHFPGHGNIKGDTHLGFVDATNTFVEDEIKPYVELKNYKDLNMVMVSHIFNSNFDEKYPASLSKKTIDKLVNEVGFKGVIISDDYDMGAIKNNYSLREIVIHSINSGVDILLFSNHIGKYDKNLAKKIHKIIKEEIKNGSINQAQIDKSYQKIIKLKENLI